MDRVSGIQKTFATERRVISHTNMELTVGMNLGKEWMV